MPSRRALFVALVAVLLGGPLAALAQSVCVPIECIGPCASTPRVCAWDYNFDGRPDVVEVRSTLVSAYASRYFQAAAATTLLAGGSLVLIPGDGVPDRAVFNVAWTVPGAGVGMAFLGLRANGHGDVLDQFQVGAGQNALGHGAWAALYYDDWDQDGRTTTPRTSYGAN